MLIPVMVLFGIVVVLGVIRDRRLRAARRRFRKNLCPHCGYSRQGAATPVCPECGKNTQWEHYYKNSPTYGGD